jgi:hypothetical protein
MPGSRNVAASASPDASASPSRAPSRKVRSLLVKTGRPDLYGARYPSSGTSLSSTSIALSSRIVHRLSAPFLASSGVGPVRFASLRDRKYQRRKRSPSSFEVGIPLPHFLDITARPAESGNRIATMNGLNMLEKNQHETHALIFTAVLRTVRPSRGTPASRVPGAGPRPAHEPNV